MTKKKKIRDIWITEVMDCQGIATTGRIIEVFKYISFLYKEDIIKFIKEEYKTDKLKVKKNYIYIYMGKGDEESFNNYKNVGERIDLYIIEEQSKTKNRFELLDIRKGE